MNDFRRVTSPLNNAARPNTLQTDRTDQSENAARTRPLEDSLALSVVSHSRLFREGLVSLLAPHLAVRLVGSYVGNTPPNHGMPNPPDHVVLIDSGIGETSTLEWTRWWRTQPSPAYVLVMEVEDNKDVILAYIEMGANGYTLKEAPPVEVANTVCHASRGLALCSPEVTAHLFERLASRTTVPSQPTPTDVSLTVREMEVLQCIAQGMSNKEIATALVIEIYTVKHHVHNILEKMNLRHRYEAARYAAEQGWVSEPVYFPRSTLTI